MTAGLQALPHQYIWLSHQSMLHRCCYDARDFTSSVRKRSRHLSLALRIPPDSAFRVHTSSSGHQCMICHAYHWVPMPVSRCLHVVANFMGLQCDAAAPAMGPRCIPGDGVLCFAGLQLRRDCHRGRDAERHQRERHPHQCVRYPPVNILPASHSADEGPCSTSPAQLWYYHKLDRDGSHLCMHHAVARATMFSRCTGAQFGGDVSNGGC